MFRKVLEKCLKVLEKSWNLMEKIKWPPWENGMCSKNRLGFLLEKKHIIIQYVRQTGNCPFGKNCICLMSIYGLLGKC